MENLHNVQEKPARAQIFFDDSFLGYIITQENNQKLM